MAYLFLAFGIAGVLIDSQWAQIAPLIFVSFYALLLGPGAFTGGDELNKNQLVSSLAENWRNPNEIAEFIIKYWYSIKYSMTAQKRGLNCLFIGLSSLVLAGWYVYSGSPIWVVAWSVINGVLVLAIGKKANKALSVLQHNKGTPQWEIACVSFVALADILDNENFKHQINGLLPQECIETALRSYAK